MAGSITPNYTLPPDAPWVMLMDGCVGGAGGEGEGAWDAAPAAVAEGSLWAGFVCPPSAEEPRSLPSPLLGIGKGDTRQGGLWDTAQTEREAGAAGTDFTHLPFTRHCGNDTACRAEELPWTTRAAKPLPSLDFSPPIVLASEGLSCWLHGPCFI